ncbi:MAG: hypothetical protein GY716_12455, partial [bacterium]|nr:hypothetical protein [bacterium]
LVEQTGTRLAQIDVTVIAAPEVLAELTADDFKVKVNMTKIKEFRLDRACPALDLAQPPTEAEDGGPAPEPRSANVTPRASYLFYFDQPHLTLEGRALSIDVARELMAELIVGESRGMILSNAHELAVIQEMSGDPEVLVEGLRRLENDRTQWDFYATNEDQRVAEVARALNESERSLVHGVATARMYQKEERMRAEKSMRRLRLAVNRLAGLDPPRVVVFFGDTLRQNAGAHYMTFFGDALARRDAVLSAMSSDALTATLPFDAVVNEAAAQGVRIYAVQGEGLQARFEPAMVSSLSMSQTQAVPHSSFTRQTHAHNTMRNMAAETGGAAFLNGTAPPKIAKRIHDDSSCLFLISFDPSEFREDDPMRVIVEPRRDDVKLRVRGRMVFQSESARRTSELLRAFAAPDVVNDPFQVQVHVVPTGFADGEYQGLLQISVPQSPLPSATWDIGASIVRTDKVRDELSGRVTVNSPGVPIVFESEIEFRPGVYEIVAVAHETNSGLIASERIALDWPDPNRSKATISPISLLQPVPGAFLRSGESRPEGSLALEVGELVRGELPSAWVGVVCRGKKERGPLRVERNLTGESVVPLPPVDLDLSEDRCAQLRDLVPANTLGPGHYRYELRVLEPEGRELSTDVRQFAVAGPES